MNLRRWMLLVFVVLFSSCSSANPVPTVTRITTTLPITHSATPSREPAQPTATPSPTPLPDQSIFQACVTQHDNQSGLTGHGILAFNHVDYSTVSKALLYDLEQRTLYDLFPPDAYILNISPDRKKLLYLYDYALTLTDSRGGLIKHFFYPTTPGGPWDYSSWLNVDTLRGVQLLNKISIENPTVRATAQAYLNSHSDVWGIVSLYRYDPLTDDYSPLRTDWPDAYNDIGVDWSIDSRAIKIRHTMGANIIYDPTLTRVVYPKNGEGVSLTDVESGNELASVQIPGWGRLPRWSDDGHNLVLVANVASDGSVHQEEFFIVSRDGIGGFRRLTNLAGKFDQDYIAEYAWSPDGTKIAFWLNTAPGDPTLPRTTSELAILDINTGEITNLCIQGIGVGTNEKVVMVFPQPVWSADGSQIMIAQWVEQNSLKYNVLIVDVGSKNAYKMIGNLEPIGWMTKEP